MALNSVVLPAPFDPMTPVIFPASTSNETPSTARTPPKITLASETFRWPRLSEFARSASGGDCKGVMESPSWFYRL